MSHQLSTTIHLSRTTNTHTITTIRIVHGDKCSYIVYVDCHRIRIAINNKYSLEIKNSSLSVLRFDLFAMQIDMFTTIANN